MHLAGRDLSLDLQGDDVRLLHKELLILGANIPDAEQREGVFGRGTFKAVRVFQYEHQLEPTGIVDERTARLINREVDARNPVEPHPVEPVEPQPHLPTSCRVVGTVTSPDRGPVAGTTVTILDRNIGSDQDLATATTDARGRYSASFEIATLRAGKTAADCQAVVRDAAGRTTAASPVAYDAGVAGAVVRLDVALPRGASGAESDALRAAVADHFAGPLADLREDDTRSDITYLANKSGWDARAVAMASLADSLANTGPNAADALGADHFYALLRAGIPADPDALYRLDAQSATGIWEQAAKTGVIPEAALQRAGEAAAAFTSRAAAHTLERPLLPGTDPLADLLTVSLGDDRAGKAAVAAGLASHRDDPGRMWDEVAVAVGPDRVDRLRLDGKLALLTLNNAAVMQAVHDAAPDLKSAGDLVGSGFHDAAKWRPLVGGRAPEFIPGPDDGVRADNYAELLAAQVRLAFPTAVLAQRVTAGELRVDPDGGRNQRVGQFLAEHAGQFEIGMQPVANYVASQGVAVAPEVLASVTKVQRLYQLTTQDRQMQVLLDTGIGSAYEVVANGRAAFESLVSGRLGPEAAAAVYEKASQVHNVVLNVATNYLTTRSAPAIGSEQARIIDPGAQLRTLQAAAPPPGSPTLESLFDSVDYCDCSHCRSVLSPAAYLVDLLLFADCPSPALANPQAVLLRRRPDLAHIPLSCENTNTALPYIDVVNETLEYFLVHDLDLAGYQGHDTAPGTASADLLASPQFVSDAAYTTLAGELFPPPLPLHRPLELLRGYLAALELPLATMLQALRRNDALERGNAADYAWTDILMERVGISRPEYRALTDHTIALADLYGLPSGMTEAAAIDALSPARDLSRRLGVSYAELVAILRTRYLNPATDLIPAMERLGLSLPEVIAVRDGVLVGAELDSRLPAGVTAGDVNAFIAAHLDTALSLILLTEELPAGVAHDPCSWAHQFLRRPDPAAPKLTAIDFVRLARFVRLWRKLDWTIPQVDAAITALFPAQFAATGADPAVDLTNHDLGWRHLLTRLGVVSEVMDRLKVKVKELDALLACWAPDNPAAPDPTRRQWLARKLRLSESELAALVEHTGLDPFAAPEPAGPPNPAPPGIVGLLDLLDECKAARIKPTQLLYLVFGVETVARNTPTGPEVDALARTLRAAFAEVESAFTVVDDPTGDIARARMALVYGAEPAEYLFSLLSGTIVSSVRYHHPQEALAPAVLAAGAGRLAYDDLRRTLSYSGVLDLPTAATIKAAGVSAELGTALDELAKASSDAVADFFARYPELRAIYQGYAASTEPEEVRRREVLAAFLPQLVAARKYQQALATLGAVLKVDPGLAAAVATDPKSLQAAHDTVAPTDPAARPALADLAGIDTAGLDAAWTWGPTPVDPPDATPPPVPTVDYGTATTRLPQGPVAGPVSVRLSGSVEAPESAQFALAVDTDATAVTLSVDGSDVPLDHDGDRWRTHDALTLRAGQFARIEITAEAIATRIALRWARPGTGWEIIPGRRLYPAGAMADLQTSYLRALKLASLASATRLQGGELGFTLADPVTQIAGRSWANALPVAGPTGDSDTDRALLDGARRLLGLARLKARYAPDDLALLAVLTAPERTLPDGSRPLETLLGWAGADLDEVLTRFGNTRAHLGDVQVLARVAVAMDVGRTLGIPAQAVVAAATNDPTADKVTDLVAALRTRFEATDWTTLTQPVHDRVRARCRDALVAAILRRMAGSADPAQRAVDTPDKMFEYFLMDVAMEPCMQTSRIRHALSSAQLFLDRCLMGLEPEVSPASVDAAQWEWMKRYRVWEANRKVFLWPENWLEPELRDDQSPFFTEVMSELLQGDVTEDRAAAALLNYLGKLEEVARLEPCGMFIQEQDPGTADDIVHVVARTTGANRKYFYRRREYGYWTAWEPVKLDIEDAPIMPVVWRGRLFLLWTKILSETPASADSAATSSQASGGLGELTLATLKSDVANDAKSTAKLKVRAMLCMSEYVNGKWQPTRTSEPTLPATVGDFPVSGSSAFNRGRLTLSVEGETGDLRVYLSGQGSASFRAYNTHSAPVRGEDVPFELDIIMMMFGPARSLDTDDAQLTATYHKTTMPTWGSKGDTSLHRDIIDGRLALTLVRPRQTHSDPWLAPFLVSDSRNSFYVQTTSQAVSIVEFNGFGVGDGYTAPAPHIPDLVWQEPPKFAKPDLLGPIATPGFGVTDPPAMRHILSEDAYIDRALSSTGVVQLGNTLIGPAGALPQVGMSH